MSLFAHNFPSKHRPVNVLPLTTLWRCRTEMSVKPREKRTAAGVLVMALAVLFFTCIDTSAKWLIIAGFPVFQIVFARYAGHLIYTLALYLPQEGISIFKSNSPGKQFLRSSFLLGATSLNFQALKYLPITLTTTIMFAGPIVITLLAVPLLSEKVGIHRVLVVCTGFLGVLVVIQPWGTAFHPAMFFCLAALVSASLYFIMTRMLAGIESNATHRYGPPRWRQSPYRHLRGTYGFGQKLWDSGLFCVRSDVLALWVIYRQPMLIDGPRHLFLRRWFTLRCFGRCW